MKEAVFENIPVAILGGGYSSDRQMPTQYVCLNKGNMTYSGNSVSTISMGASVNFEQICEKLNVDLSSDFDIGIFSTSLQAEYARYIQDDLYSSAFYFYSSVTLPTKISNPPT